MLIPHLFPCQDIGLCIPALHIPATPLFLQYLITPKNQNLCLGDVLKGFPCSVGGRKALLPPATIADLCSPKRVQALVSLSCCCVPEVMEAHSCGLLSSACLS